MNYSNARRMIVERDSAEAVLTDLNVVVDPLGGLARFAAEHAGPLVAGAQGRHGRQMAHRLAAFLATWCLVQDTLSRLRRERYRVSQSPAPGWSLSAMPHHTPESLPVPSVRILPAEETAEATQAVTSLEPSRCL
jgi:hypothetical protein